MAASEFLFKPAPLRRSHRSQVKGKILFSGDISKTVGGKEARLELYFDSSSLPQRTPDELQWNLYRDRPSDVAGDALAIALSFLRETGRNYEYTCTVAIDFVYLHKAIFPKAEGAPNRCWLAVWW